MGYSNPSVERNSTASTTNTKKPTKTTQYHEHCFARWAARRQIVVDAVVGAFHRELISVGVVTALGKITGTLPGAMGDDRSVLLVPDPVRLAIRVEEPTCGFTCCCTDADLWRVALKRGHGAPDRLR